MKIKVYGNQALVDMLTKNLSSGHICHAYLLYGKKGIGKQTLSRYIAQGILCKQNPNKPCGECISCRKVASNNHPDLITLMPEDGKVNIGIDAVRDLRQDAYISPNESDYKVYILPDIERLTDKTFNALLKVLEEPPETAIFIITAPSKAMTPATILSRCVSLGVYPISDAECTDAVEEIMPDVPESKRIEAVSQADGIIGRALELLSDGGKTQANEIHDRIVDGIIKMDEYAVLAAVSMIKDKDKLLFAEVIDNLLVTLRAAVMLKASARECINERQKALAFMLTSGCSQALFDVLQRATELSDGNVKMSILTGWLAAEIMNAIK